MGGGLFFVIPIPMNPTALLQLLAHRGTRKKLSHTSQACLGCRCIINIQMGFISPLLALGYGCQNRRGHDTLLQGAS